MDYKPKLDLSEKGKIDLYREGAYQFEVPGVSPGSWTTADWIRYIGEIGFISADFALRNPQNKPIQEGEFYHFVKEHLGNISDDQLVIEYLKEHVVPKNVPVAMNHQMMMLSQTIIDFRKYEVEYDPAYPHNPGQKNPKPKV